MCTHSRQSLTTAEAGLSGDSLPIRRIVGLFVVAIGTRYLWSGL